MLNRALVFLLGSLCVPIFTTPFWSREPARPCARDVARFCAGVPRGGGRIDECLEQHREGLSRACRAYLNSIETNRAPLTASAPSKLDDSPSAPFSISYEAGQRDAAGNFMGGTEVMNLVAYHEKLYAGIGYWEDRPGSDPSLGPQVLVKDSARAAWRVEHTFSPNDAGGEKLVRITALGVATFTTNSNGKPLSPPVSVLIAGSDLLSATFGVTAAGDSSAFGFSRDEHTGAWSRFAVRSRAFRAMAMFRDPETKVDRIFLGGAGAAGTPGKLLSGVYDPHAPGGIDFDKDEFDEFADRVMAFAEANGSLYFSAKSAVFQRYKNGAQPQWRRVYSYGERLKEPRHEMLGEVRAGGNSGMRGLTVIPNPEGGGQALLGAIEGVPGEIVRINPNRGYAGTVEQNIDDLLQKHWGYLPGRTLRKGERQTIEGNTGYVLAAYNNMPVISQKPTTDEPLLFIGMQSHDPMPGRGDSAWYLIREAPATYTLHEVNPLASRGSRLKPLIAIRTAILSPFPEERGKIMYVGGYDCDWRPAHNTAWIYRAGVDTILHDGTR